MGNKKLISCIYVMGKEEIPGFMNYTETEGAVEAAKYFSDNGADELLIFDLSVDDLEHEKSIHIIKEIARAVEIPISAGGNVKRLEDVKKLLYAGVSKVVLNFSKESNSSMLEEASKRFGKESMVASITSVNALLESREALTKFASEVLLYGMTDLHQVKTFAETSLVPVSIFCQQGEEPDLKKVLSISNVSGISCAKTSIKDTDFMELKRNYKAFGIPVVIFENEIQWQELKLNSDGMIPVVVQDYKTDEVLMLAYMNEEAFLTTISTGKMTYWSRSRKELWTKGMTSGHFQYVKALTADCDYDTILARVSQVGAACHTGNKTCFFHTIAKKEGVHENPLKVFEHVYSVIADRKRNPKEGSYTNYLFEKGLDKILKKVGEEAAEIIIAAKNPDPEEIKYEISDFLYHAMVLMVERGVTWEDITRELANR